MSSWQCDGWHSCVSVQLHSQKCQVDSVIGELMCFSSHHSQECQVDGVAGDLICVQFYFAIRYLVFRTNRLFFVKKEPITLLLFLEKWITLFLKRFTPLPFFKEWEEWWRAICSLFLKQSQKVWYKFLSPLFTFFFKKEQSPLLKRANHSCVRKN